MVNKIKITPIKSKYNEFNIFKLEWIIDKIPLSVLNGIRRILIDELEHNAFNISIQTNTYEHYDEEYNIPSYVTHKIEMIPLRPNISKKIKNEIVFNINANNLTDKPITLLASEIKAMDNKDYNIFNKLTPICNIMPGKTININNITINSDSVLKSNDKYRYKYSIGKNCAIRYDSIDNLDIINGTLKAAFNTIKDNNEVLLILKQALECLIDKFKMISYDIVDNNNFVIYNETYTIANIVKHYLYTSNLQQITRISFNVDNNNSTFLITMNKEYDIKKILDTEITNIIKYLNEIKNTIK
jgi:DNA-directed RNA polymerase subunit L